MSELDISIVNLFKQYYPKVDHTLLDNNVLAILIESMFEIEKTKYSDTDSNINSDTDSEIELNPIIEENYIVATKLIPNQIESGDIICVKGRINQVSLNILFDSGCQTSTVFESVVKKIGLEYLVDTNAKTYCNGINGITKTCGMVWCTQLELKINTESDNYISVPIKLSVIPDTKNHTNITTDLNHESVDILIGTDFMKASACIINFSKKTIEINQVQLKY